MSQALAHYAGLVHQRFGGEHHVASPLGAWLLLALCAPLASGSDRDALVDALGLDPEVAAHRAAALMDNVHDVVGSGVAVWNRPQVETDRLAAWRKSLPRATTTGDIPPQHELDDWAAERTLGLIRSFPLEVNEDDVILLASALATKVSWEVPYDLVPGAELGASSGWATLLERVLASPFHHPRHDQFVTETKEIGTAVVHNVRARGGLWVMSVAAAPEVPAHDVLRVAYELACAEAVEPRSLRRVSLFDLPVGDGPMWRIQEEEVETAARDGREELCRAILPAWSADSKVDLTPDGLGFPSAARALSEVLGHRNLPFRAAQSAMAAYSRVGFEAAAVTGLAISMSRPQMVQGLCRTADLRFGHPFGVVAVAVDENENPRASVRTGQRGPWHGIPAFSAWVAEPSEADGK
jgi:hypothetical protein